MELTCWHRLAAAHSHHYHVALVVGAVLGAVERLHQWWTEAVQCRKGGGGRLTLIAVSPVHGVDGGR